MNLEIHGVKIDYPENCGIIIGQGTSIKTVDYLKQIIADTAPQAHFGVAFSEAAGECLIRTEGSDDEMIKRCTTALKGIGAGHVFCILLCDAHPLDILNQVKNCPGVCTVYCATMNPLQVIIATTLQGWGVVGVIDGLPPQGIEGEEERQERHNLLRER
ncbi:adenosine-specific kinase [Pelotalea chapellei]|uniref:Adenosine monophosphate-protein transferase n=1 Tax=Pelotalea chapellei TaxID=44671 RepID=A0ABS5U3G9_9BACT|nr:adenosine-specific kinase [Pelotalea chapellei]MBT1070212.1 adenosine monophosphate-protein transferase [Pelotalea chapellei]